MADSTSRRHYRTRPMRELTEDELHALITVGNHLALFAPGLADQLGTLTELAHLEDSGRMLHEALTPKGETGEVE